MSATWPMVRLRELLRRSEETATLQPDSEYRELTVKLWGKGVVLRGVVTGTEIASSRRFVAQAGQFILSRIDARNGALGIVPKELDGAVVTNDFPLFKVDEKRLQPAFLGWLSRTAGFIDMCERASEGTTNRVRLQEDKFLTHEISLPPPAVQRQVVARIEESAAKIEEATALRRQATEEAEALSSRASAVLFETMNFQRKPLGKAADKKTGVAYRAEDFAQSGEVPVVRLKEIGTKRPTVYLRNPDKYPNVWLESGDIILAKTSFSTGAMCLWPGPRAVLNQNAVRLRANDSLEQRFLFAWLGYQVTRYLADHLADPNFYPYIREADLVRWLVPMPPTSVQRRIIAHLDALQAQVDALKRLQAETAAEMDALLPSILDKAFKGEL